MKRSGYSDNFNKDKGVFKETNQDILELDEYKHELVTKKSQAFSNIIEFGIGIILLTFCRFYLQTHPAEKISLFSGMEVMWQKATVLFSNISVEESKLLDQKQNLEKTMQEIVLLSEENNCVDAQTKKNIADSLSKLQQMDLEMYTKQHTAFNSVVGLYYTKVKQDCTQE